MSRFQNQTNGGHPTLFAETFVEQVKPTPSATAPFALEQWFGRQYADTLWPRSRYTGNDPAASLVIAEVFPRVAFWNNVQPKGAGRWAIITGITKDSTGAVLGGCAVHVFRTSDDVERDQTTSDVSDGTYTVSVDTDAGFYCVAYKPGSPDVAGTTVNTLTGS